MQTPKVSVIVPVYNRFEYLPEAIKSVKDQTCNRYEIIVVDDGSTENQDEIRQLCHSEGIHYIRQPNEGLSAARNTGIRSAKGEYIVFLDADDRILPQKIESQSRFLDAHPEIGVVYSDGYLFKTNQDGTEAKIRLSENGFIDKSLRETADAFNRLIFHNSFPVHSAMVRRDCLDKAGFFDETLLAYEDWDLWLRIACSCRFAFLDELVAEYRISTTNMSRDESRMRSAYEKVQEKILELEKFSTLSSKVKAEVYYQWAMTALFRSKPLEASLRFKKAFQTDHRHFHSIAGFILVRSFGSYAIHFYRIKQTLFGTRTRGKKPFSWTKINDRLQ